MTDNPVDGPHTQLARDARTVTVDGEGFPPSLTGRVSIMTGAPGTGGIEVVVADVTTTAAGVLPSTPLIVPDDQEAGDYHIHAEYTGVTVDDLPLTVTAGPVGPTEALQLDTLDTPALLGVVHALLAQIAASRRRT